MIIQCVHPNCECLDYCEITDSEEYRTQQAKRVFRRIEVHCLPELPNPDRRECCIELKATGEWLIARYGEVSRRWMICYDAPVEFVPENAVAMWFYIDEAFAPKDA